MTNSNASWGIEVGANAIKAMRLERRGEGVQVTEFAVLPFKQVLTAPDVDMDEEIQQGLNQFLEQHEIGNEPVVVSVPGHMAFARFAKLPPVDPKKIPDVVRFEAEQQIPFAIDQVEWDYQTFAQSDSPEVEVGIFAMTKDRVLSWLSNFHEVDIPVHAVVISPAAVYNAMAYDLDVNPESPGTVMMDIGASATDLVISEGERTWLRTIPIGGNHFTEALVRSFNLSYAKAEKLKREAATSKYARQIFQAMRPVFVDLVQEVQKSIGYYQSMTRDAELTRLIGIGSTFRLPGLQKFLKQQLQIEVSRLDSFERIEAPNDREMTSFGENALSLATAYGLALQGLEMERISCNLLPVHMVREQVWHAKQPWMAAAAAVLALCAGVGFIAVSMQRSAFEGQAEVRDEISDVLSEAQHYQSKWSQISSEQAPREKIKNLRQMLHYRHLWPMILQDIDKAMEAANPQPVLLNGTLQQIQQQIPDRDQRKQIIILQISSQYQFGEQVLQPYDLSEIEALPTSQGGMLYGPRGGTYGPGYGRAYAPRYGGGMGGEMGGGMGVMPPGMQGGGMYGGMTSGMEEQQNMGPPQIVLTIQGRTPYGQTRSETTTFLTETFIHSLEQQNQQRIGLGEVPYVVQSAELESIQPMGAAGKPKITEQEQNQVQDGPVIPGRPSASGNYLTPSSIGGGYAPAPGGGYGPRYRPGYGGGPYGPGYGGGMRGGLYSGLGSEYGGMRSIGSISSQVLDEMPSSHLLEVDRSQDQKFRIKWKIQILKPGQEIPTGDEAQEDQSQTGISGPVASAE